MSAIYQNLMSGTTTTNPLLIGGTTVDAANFANLDVVSAPDYMWLVLDPEGLSGAPEIVKITTHTSSNTACTITRAQQGTTARQHASGTAWVTAVTEDDLNELPFRKLTTTGDTLYASAANTASRLAIGTAGQVLKVNSGATAPEWGQVAAAGIASDAVTTAKILDANVTAAKLSTAARAEYYTVADNTARDALSPSEGWHVWTLDTNRLWVYDGSAWVLMGGSLPRCRAQRATSQSISTVTATAIQFNSADIYDSDAMHDIVTNNTRITVPAGLGGVWSIGYGFRWATGGAANTTRVSFMRVNAGSERYGYFEDEDGTGSIGIAKTVQVDQPLAAGDYIDLIVYHNEAGSFGQDVSLVPITLWAHYRSPF
ncbi:MAG TPA: hypothetical protein VJQ57_09330 [Acidimicrobiia bacterium]|nr:hypothetical protein [Acidimicrobiia bacterium]